MPCDTRRQPGQTLEERMAEVAKALKLLEQRLLARAVTIRIGQSGAVAFDGWSAADSSGVSDVCAFRTLSAEGSWALRQAVARAESLSGRRVNPAAVAAGVHSHDGGGTWHEGH